jgi:hypothetical protein
MDVGVRNLKRLTVTSPRVIEIIASPQSRRSQYGGDEAEPARLGDTPDRHRVDPFAVDDVDGGGDHVSAVTSPGLRPGGFLTVDMRTA